MENLDFENYQFKEQWRFEPAVKREIKVNKDLCIFAVGMKAIGQNDLMLTGSAAEVTGYPVGRASYELLERILTVEAQKSGQQSFTCKDLNCYAETTVDKSIIFPESNNPRQWIYSKSNGIAIYSNWKEAALRAALELVERDSLLYSWYGYSTPLDISYHYHISLQDMLRYQYEVVALQFESQPIFSDETFVTAVFLLPKEQNYPLIYGFGSQFDLNCALSKAEGECLQRLAFLWGIELSDDEGPFKVSPMYHQDCFLTRHAVNKIKSWLYDGNGARDQFKGNKGMYQFVDMTPEYLKEKFYLVKALNSELIPLTFGYCDLAFCSGVDKSRLIHPII